MRTKEQALEKVAEFKAVQPGSARFGSFDIHFDGDIAIVHHMISSRHYGDVDIANKTITTFYGKALEPLKTLLYFFYDGATDYVHNAAE